MQVMSKMMGVLKLPRIKRRKNKYKTNSFSFSEKIKFRFFLLLLFLSNEINTLPLNLGKLPTPLNDPHPWIKNVKINFEPYFTLKKIYKTTLFNFKLHFQNAFQICDSFVHIGFSIHSIHICNWNPIWQFPKHQWFTTESRLDSMCLWGDRALCPQKRWCFGSDAPRFLWNIPNLIESPWLFGSPFKLMGNGSPEKHSRIFFVILN